MSPAPARVAVVTGGASGIGRCVVQELAHRGWQVASLDLAPSEADLAFEVDMRDAGAVSAAVAQVETRLGPVGSAVSVAGHYEMLPVCDISPEAWQRMLSVHLGGLRNLVTATLPGMIERGTGSIVATASELAVGGGGPGDAHYAAAKGAVLGLVRSLAPEVAAHGVRVNAVAPGPTDTPLLAADSPWRAPAYLATLPAQRLTSPEEVALCVAFLVDEATFCTGETLNPNAGAVI